MVLSAPVVDVILMVLHQDQLVILERRVVTQVIGVLMEHQLIRMEAVSIKVMVALVEQREEQSQDQIMQSKVHSTQQQSKERITHNK
jgi:hypothetical protein